MNDLSISVQSRGQAAVVHVAGEVDMHRSPQLRDRLHMLDTKKVTRVVIDLSEVPYMDSSGIATLVEAMQKYKRADTALTLASLQPRVKAVVEIARLDQIFDLAGSVDEALEE